MIAKRYDDEVMLGVERCDDGKYKYCTTDGKLAFKKPGTEGQLSQRRSRWTK